MAEEFPKKPASVKLGPFAYDDYGITVNGIPRASSELLGRVFAEDPLKPSRHKPSKRWITAQLQHFGLDFRPADTTTQLRAILENAYKDGQCNCLTPSTISLEKTLSGMYEKMQDKYEVRKQHWRMTKFAGLASPSEEARFDTSLFMAKYFLTEENGLPDKEKQREALILQNVFGCQFENAAKAIPGLAVCITSPVTVVGWEDTFSRGMDAGFAKLAETQCPTLRYTLEANFDLGRFMAKYFLDGPNGSPDLKKTPDPIKLMPKFEERLYDPLAAAVLATPGLYVRGTIKKGGVWSFLGWDIHKIMHELEETNKVGDSERELDETMLDAVWSAKLEEHSEYLEGHVAPTGPLQVADLQGQYIVRCEAIDPWGMLDLWLAIHRKHPEDPGTHAGFSLGQFKGTMLLASSCDGLDRTREAYEARWEKKHLYPGNPHRKAREPSTIRRFDDASKPTRLYLQWAGTVNQCNHVDEKNVQIGYLDFAASMAEAHGVIMGPAFEGRSYAWSVYKHSDTTEGWPSPWTSFDYWAGYEGRSRHGEMAISCDYIL
ncbi:hypothetical protein BO78DRAFT_301363 [Aspergillus sclerotiicarbonarius CBS 121057]|uniref:Uncharacterized protein n=1 Tax=Aspergillus sclerotiicarbonarius (strain CBS 121057 / IBT 28362) TaxID=1448318 RepID=A0A319F8H0_ASPSB|nr:hypothetical protein BO78DRAFT_301363 [Aspergillus sclerotiicarbonarius CBS 121057]